MWTAELQYVLRTNQAPAIVLVSLQPIDTKFNRGAESRDIWTRRVTGSTCSVQLGFRAVNEPLGAYYAFDQSAVRRVTRVLVTVLIGRRSPEKASSAGSDLPPLSELRRWARNIVAGSVPFSTVLCRFCVTDNRRGVNYTWQYWHFIYTSSGSRWGRAAGYQPRPHAGGG